MVNKSFLKQAMKNKAVESEIAMLDSQAPESHIQSSPDVEEHNVQEIG